MLPSSEGYSHTEEKTQESPNKELNWNGQRMLAIENVRALKIKNDTVLHYDLLINIAGKPHNQNKYYIVHSKNSTIRWKIMQK